MNVIAHKAVGAGMKYFLDHAATLDGARDDREKATNLLKKSGLPTRRVEAWKYTSLREIDDVPFVSSQSVLTDALVASAKAHIDVAGIPELATMSRIVFVNGRFASALSALPDDVEIGFFADNSVFGPIASPERDAITTLNTALAEDGVQIRVPNGVDAGHIALVSVTIANDEVRCVSLRHRVVVEQGARLQLFDVATGEGNYLHNVVFECALGESAFLGHTKLQDDSEQARHLACVYADLAGSAEYDGFTLTLGSALARHEVHTRLLAAHAITHVNAAQLLRGTQHADVTSVITHGAVDCNSRQTVKNVLAEQSHGVFQGKIYVDQVAQKTDGYQMNQALLLSEGAQIDAKPELEIYADDVKCSHGATVGALDPEQLFYLRSRGVPQSEAESILVRAFLFDAIDLVRDETLRAVLDRKVEASWNRGRAA